MYGKDLHLHRSLGFDCTCYRQGCDFVNDYSAVGEILCRQKLLGVAWENLQYSNHATTLLNIEKFKFYFKILFNIKLNGIPNKVF